MEKKTKIIIASLILLVVLGGILLYVKNKNNSSKSEKIRIVTSTFLESGPIYVVDELNLLNKYMSGVKLDIIYVNGGSAQNEAFASDRTDFGVMGLPTFLVGADKGVPFKIASTLSYSEIVLQTNDPTIKSLKDIKSDDKIAMGSLTGPNATFLYIASEKQLGKWDALQDRIVPMKSDDALLALINKTGITLTTNNFIRGSVANEAGCKTILTSSEILDSEYMNFDFIGSEKFYNENRKAYNALLSAIDDAIELINKKDPKAISIIAKHAETDEDVIVKAIDSKQIKYSSNTFDNIDVFVDMAYKAGNISKKMAVKDLTFRKIK